MGSPPLIENFTRSYLRRYILLKEAQRKILPRLTTLESCVFQEIFLLRPHCTVEDEIQPLQASIREGNSQKHTNFLLNSLLLLSFGGTVQVRS